MRQDAGERLGVLFGVLAFSFWGFTAIYYKQTLAAAPLEVLGHRIVWCALLLLPLAFATARRRRDIAHFVLRGGWERAALFGAALLLILNWFLFIYAVSIGRVRDGSLGYYINPLVNVLFGMLFLGERLRLVQWGAVGLAVLGVITLAWATGDLSWIPLVLACSFGLYGLIRKQLSVGPVTGLFLETAMLTPLALFFFAAIAGGRATGVAGGLARQGLAFLEGGWELRWLLILAGPVTAFPLLFFTAAARRIRLSTLGFLQYLAPTEMFVLSVFVYNEPFTRGHLVAFSLIWAALGLYSIDALRTVARGAPGAEAPP